MSAVLSNVYLIDYDQEMYELSKKCGFSYFRYCDDILVICDSDKAQEIKKIAIDRIADDHNLSIQDKKVETIDFKTNSKGLIRGFKRDKLSPNEIPSTNSTNERTYYKPLQYLGFEFNGQTSRIRSSSLSRYFRKTKGRISKTILMAYGRAGKSDDKIFLKQIFEKYTHFGKRNFLSYAYNASNETYSNSKGDLYEGLNSPAIKKQLARHIQVIKEQIEKNSESRFKFKLKKNKSIKKRIIKKT